MGHDGHFKAGGGVDRIGQPADVVAFGIAAHWNGHGQGIGPVAHGIFRRGDQLADAVVGGKAARLNDQRRLTGILPPQMLGRPGLNGDVVRPAAMTQASASGRSFNPP